MLTPPLRHKRYKEPSAVCILRVSLKRRGTHGGAGLRGAVGTAAAAAAAAVAPPSGWKGYFSRRSESDWPRPADPRLAGAGTDSARPS